MFVFFLSSRMRLSHTEVTTHHLLLYMFQNLLREFAVAIWRRNLPWEFAARICRRNLPWVFAGCTCKQICFSTCKQILFIWKQTFFIREQNFFVRSSLLTVFLFAIAVAVMGHRKIVFLIVKYIFKLLAIQES